MIYFFTGAGISAPSGIQTFRGSDGLWENHSVRQVCFYPTWKMHFNAVHAFYNARRAGMAAVQPNEAHFAVARIQAKYGARIYTQNIDDLFEKAGCADVVHLHGRIQDMRCTACDTTFEIGWRQWGDNDRCIKCNSRKAVKPGVVFFEEGAPQYPPFWKVLDGMTRKDIFIVVGTSGSVINLNRILPLLYGPKVLLNLDPSDPEVLNEALFDHVIHESADTGMAEIEELVRMAY